jgi:tetratricopeptide (TPR) repeat protein
VAASWHVWHARPIEAREWVERAARLLEGRPPTRAKALLLAERARIEMVNYQYDTAIELAEEAIRQARLAGDVVIEADALVTNGVCLAGLGDRRAIELLERGLELVGHSGRVAGRAYTNLGSAWTMFGEPRRAADASVAGVALSEREGDLQSAWFLRGNLLGARYALGEWDEAWAAAEELIGRSEASQMETVAVQIRAQVLEARGAPDEAVAETERRIVDSRDVAEAQTMWPNLIAFAGMLRRRGRTAEAGLALSEVVDAMRASQSVGDAQEWHVELMLELREASRVEEGREIAARVPEGPWREVCVPAIEGDYVGAADLLAVIGEQPLQAQLRLLAARSLATAGRLAEAEAQLELARAFYRKVGATAFLAEADRIVAAAS